MKVLLISLLLFSLIQPIQVSAQDELEFEFTSDVHRTYPSLSITRQGLFETQTLEDFNKHFKASWVKEYESVAITTIHDGSPQISYGSNDSLTDEQKKQMNHADYGSKIKVVVRYLPDNTLKQNDMKTFDFSFIIEPDNEAVFSGGARSLEQYLKENVFEQVSFDKFRQHHLSAVSFTVDEQVRVVDAVVAESSSDEETDNILLKAVCNMPMWQPAEYANGKKVRQDFVLTAGDINSCVVNLINIRTNLLAEND